MPRLVETDLAGAGDLEARHESEALVGDRCNELDSAALELRDSAFDVVAHQKQGMLSVGSTPARPGMERELCRRQGEDQPSVACIDGTQAQHVPEERPCRLRVLRENDRVRAGDHRRHSIRGN